MQYQPDAERKQTVSSKITQLLGVMFASAMSLYAVYIGVMGSLIVLRQRSILLFFAIGLSIIVYRVNGKIEKRPNMPWYDWVLLLVSCISFGYMIINATILSDRLALVTDLTMIQIIIGIGAIIVVVESGRRVLGNAMGILLVITILYAYFGSWISGVWGHRFFDVPWLVDHFYYTPNGLFGVPVGIVSTYVALFVVFGIFLERTGGGMFFMNFMSSMFGHVRGGPAKAAVFSSALMASLSGSVTANVVTTGSFSIPLMKKTGYNKNFAAAVEAVASTGGQIMPPVMGATAFLVAEFSGFSYKIVALSALIPAVLYFVSLVFMIDFEAARLNLKGMPRSELPVLSNVLKKGGYFFIPFVIIVYMIMTGYSPLRAALYGLISVIIIAYVRRESWLSPRDWLEAMTSAGHGILIPAVACGAAGMIIGTFTLGGLGMQINNIIVGLSGGNLLFALVLTMIANIILGMGMPAPIAYLIQVSFTIPALVQLGAPELSAHLFVLFFSALSFVTPPVAMGAYAAASIARSDPMRTGFIAWRLALAAYIIPFAFVYGPGLLTSGTPIEIIHVTFTAAIGTAALAGCVIGWFWTYSYWLERVVLAVGAVMCIIPNGLSDLGGIMLIGMVLSMQIMRSRNKKESTEENEVLSEGVVGD